MSNQPQLYYSNRCTHSRQVLQTLQTLNKAALVNTTCIDNVPRHQLPPFLKSVPTLYLPETKDILVGQAIYAYIAKPVSRREVPVAAAGQQIATQGPPQAAAGGGEPSAWGFGGGGLTEAFSDWNKPTQFAHSDQLQYTYLGGMGATQAMEPQRASTEPKNIQQRAGGDDIQSRLEQMRAQRDKEFTPVSRQ